MRRLSCLIALLACLVLALPAFAAPQKADAISGISSEKVLDIVKANKGKLVFINFFATWCPPCRQELTRVQKDLIDRFAGRDFLFLPVSRGEKRSDVAAFREKTGYTFPMGLDSTRTIYDRYATNFIPRNYLIDRDGRIITATIGYSPEEFDELIAAIERALAGKE